MNIQKRKKKRKPRQHGSLPKPPAVFQVPCFLLPPPPTPPPIRSQRNKDRLINSRTGVNVAKSSQTPTKVNAVPQSEKRGEKRRRDGGGEKIWGSNASLMRLLVVSAVGAWHRHGAVSQPTKICSACRISAALFCLRPTHTEKHTLAPHTHSVLQISDVFLHDTEAS